MNRLIFLHTLAHQMSGCMDDAYFFICLFFLISILCIMFFMFVLLRSCFLFFFYMMISCQKPAVVSFIDSDSLEAKAALTRAVTYDKEASAMPGELPGIYMGITNNKGRPPDEEDDYVDYSHYYLQDIAYSVIENYNQLKDAVDEYINTKSKAAQSRVQGHWQNIRYYENIFWLCAYGRFNSPTYPQSRIYNYLYNYMHDWRFTSVGEMPLFCNKQDDLPETKGGFLQYPIKGLGINPAIQLDQLFIPKWLNQRCPMVPFAFEYGWNGYNSFYGETIKNNDGDVEVTLDIVPREKSTLLWGNKISGMTKVFDDDFRTISLKTFNDHWNRGSDHLLGGDYELASYNQEQVTLRSGNDGGVVLAMRNCKPSECLSGALFVSGKIEAKDYAASTGCFQFVAKLPNTIAELPNTPGSLTGIWSAGSMLSQPADLQRTVLGWPGNGGIDVMKITQNHTLGSFLHMSLHTGNPQVDVIDHSIGNYYYNPSVDFSSGFHTYTACWDEHRVEFYLEDDRVRSIVFDHLHDMVDPVNAPNLSKGSLYKEICCSSSHKFLPGFNLSAGGRTEAFNSVSNLTDFYNDTTGRVSPIYYPDFLSNLTSSINKQNPEFVIRSAALYEGRPWAE